MIMPTAIVRTDTCPRCRELVAQSAVGTRTCSCGMLTWFPDCWLAMVLVRAPDRRGENEGEQR